MYGHINRINDIMSFFNRLGEIVDNVVQETEVLTSAIDWNFLSPEQENS